MKLILLLLTLSVVSFNSFGANSNKSIEYFLWPAEKLKERLDSWSACEFILDGNVTPNESQLVELQAKKPGAKS